MSTSAMLSSTSTTSSSNCSIHTTRTPRAMRWSSGSEFCMGIPGVGGVTVFKFHTIRPPLVGLFHRLPASLLSHPPRPRHRPGWHAGRIMRSPPWRVALGKAVRMERVRRGWSLRRAEGESGVSDSTWQRIETGHEVHDQSLRDIEDALEWSPGRCFEIMARAAR